VGWRLSQHSFHPAHSSSENQWACYFECIPYRKWGRCESRVSDRLRSCPSILRPKWISFGHCRVQQLSSFFHPLTPQEHQQISSLCSMEYVSFCYRSLRLLTQEEAAWEASLCALAYLNWKSSQHHRCKHSTGVLLPEHNSSLFQPWCSSI